MFYASNRLSFHLAFTEIQYFFWKLRKFFKNRKKLSKIAKHQGCQSQSQSQILRLRLSIKICDCLSCDCDNYRNRKTLRLRLLTIAIADACDCDCNRNRKNLRLRLFCDCDFFAIVLFSSFVNNNKFITLESFLLVIS